ncbi:RICIN domain-containing protein [Streptomyces sp. NPDC001675]
MGTSKTSTMDTKAPRWRAAKALAVLGAVLASIVVAAPSASASDTTNFLRSWQTGRCLDSNAEGRVYTSPCQEGNRYQQWRLVTRTGSNGHDLAWLQNDATSRILSSDGWSLQTKWDSDNKLDTTTWWEGLGPNWQDVNLRANSGLVNNCLASDASGQAFMAQCDGGDWEDWKHGF